MANFQTPAKAKAVSRMTKEPLLIPPSPFLERLGYGTGNLDIGTKAWLN